MYHLLYRFENMDEPTERARIEKEFRFDQKSLDVLQQLDRASKIKDISAPDVFGEESFPDANIVAEYIDQQLNDKALRQEYEAICLQSDMLLAELTTVWQLNCLIKQNHDPQYQSIASISNSCRYRLYYIGQNIGEDNNRIPPIRFINTRETPIKERSIIEKQESEFAPKKDDTCIPMEWKSVVLPEMANDSPMEPSKQQIVSVKETVSPSKNKIPLKWNIIDKLRKWGGCLVVLLVIGFIVMKLIGKTQSPIIREPEPPPISPTDTIPRFSTKIQELDTVTNTKKENIIKEIPRDASDKGLEKTPDRKMDYRSRIQENPSLVSEDFFIIPEQNNAVFSKRPY